MEWSGFDPWLDYCVLEQETLLLQCLSLKKKYILLHVNDVDQFLLHMKQLKK